MRIAVISITENGFKISCKISESLEDTFLLKQYSYKSKSENVTGFESVSELINNIFDIYDGIIFICSVGIAVRAVASHIKSKLTDPAVIVIDDSGRFAISLLSGHIGGANELTHIIAEKIGALPIITTATDSRGKFSPDTFAKSNGLYINDMNIAKMIASEVIKDKKIGLYCEYEVKNIPKELLACSKESNLKYGICISEKLKKPFEITLNLIPQKFVIGTGCRKNISPDLFEDYILKMLRKNNISLNEIYCISTVDIKKDEQAIIKFSRKYHILFKTYTVDELLMLDGNFSASDFVRNHIGVDNVCERSAVMGGNMLRIKKQAENGITFALAEREINIDFERKSI